MGKPTELKRPSVFIVNKGFHDYSPAEEYGEIVYMSTDPSGIAQLHTSTMARLFQPYIEASDPEDYILVTAFTVMVSIASAMFAAKHKRLNLLIYRPADNRYEVRRLKFPDRSKTSYNMMGEKEAKND